MAEIDVVEENDALTHIALSGRLDATGVGAIDLKFTSHTAARKRPALVDLSQVEFLASLGIGMLVRAAQALRAHGAAMVLIAPQGPVEETLRVSMLDRVVGIAADREEALRLLASGF